jgi:hypothetical protein
LTATTEILNLADSEKENVNCFDSNVKLSPNTLGAIVRDVWKGRVLWVKRGPLKRKQTFFLNLKRKLQVIEYNQTLIKSGLESLEDLEPPMGWTVLKKNNEFTYLRIEHSNFRSHRQITELSVRMSDGKLDFKLKRHGCAIDLKKMHNLEMGSVMRGLSVKDEVALIIDFISSSYICTGILIPTGEEVSAMVPHVFGEYEDLLGNIKEHVAYAADCKIISAPGTYCSACSYLQILDRRRKKRKIERNEIKPNTNKRYLSKEDVVSQLKQEQNAKKNAERREHYWRQKFENQSLKIVNEDHEDLGKILEKVKKEDVPEDMECLLEQQRKVLNTSSKNGYRWHPK